MSTALAPIRTEIAPRSAADRHPVLVYLARLTSANSRRAMAGALRNVVRILTSGREDDPLGVDWAALRYQHCQAVRTALAERLSPATVNLALAALRGVLKEAWRLGLMDAETYHRAVDLDGVRGSTLPAGRHLQRRELQRLFQICEKDEGVIGRRDAAIFAVLVGGGLRRTELVSLDLQDYSAETGEIRVLHGKGRKARIVPLASGASDAVEDWLAVRGADPGPLFWPTDGRGRQPVNRRMTNQAIYDLCRRRAKQARVQGFSPHDFRRTFVSDLLDAGADMVAVQGLAGHANVNTTARYDRRGEEAKRRAAALVSVPYRKAKRPGADLRPSHLRDVS